MAVIFNLEFNNDDNILKKLNKLYRCPNCNRYHRKYLEKIKELSDYRYLKVKKGTHEFVGGEFVKRDKKKKSKKNPHTCPYCYNFKTERIKEKLAWTKDHSDCFYLDKEGYKNFLESLNEIQELSYEELTNEQPMNKIEDK